MIDSLSNSSALDYSSIGSPHCFSQSVSLSPNVIQYPPFAETNDKDSSGTYRACIAKLLQKIKSVILENEQLAFRDNSAFSNLDPILEKTSRTGTENAVDKVGARHLSFAELGEKIKEAFQTCRAYQNRIETLRGLGVPEGIAVNPSSEQDFWYFVFSVPFAQKAGLVLADNGNLRAIWDGEDGSHLGIQFLGDRMLQYVIFRQRKGICRISRVAGRDSFVGVQKQVRAFDLEALLEA